MSIDACILPSPYPECVLEQRNIPMHDKLWQGAPALFMQSSLVAGRYHARGAVSLD